MANVSESIADEILRQGEVRLQAQLELAMSADQRSITYLGISGGAAIGLVAASAAVLTADKGNVPLGVAFLAGAGMLLTSAVLAGIATSPAFFHIPGTRASLLADSANFEVVAVKLALAERYEERLVENDKTLVRNGRYMQCALIAAPLSILAGVAAYFISRHVGL